MKNPSLLRVIEIDYYANLAVLLPGGFWVVMLFMVAIKSQNLERALYVGIVLTMLGLAALAWRYGLAWRLLTSGQEVPGTISRTWFFRDRARITCTYSFKGRKYQATQSMRFSRRVMGLKAGERVRLVVNSSMPHNFLIRQLFE
jgi:hypothetical protein